MKNKSILILGFAVLFNVNLYSQAIGFEGKRFSADLTVGESVLNKYYQFIYDEIDTENSIYKSVFIPAFRINGSVNYTLSRKYSLGVIFSGSKNSFETINGDYYDEHDVDFSVGKVNYFGVGLKLSKFRSNFISPVGSSIGYYVKYNTVSVKEMLYVKEKPGNNYDRENATTSLKMNYFNIGVSWDNMSFISKTQPIYIKYGVSVGFTVFRTYKVGEEEEKYSKSEFYNSEYYDFNYNGLSQLSNYYNLFELVELNFGIGYIFGK